ncbi:MAG: hypothetical protein F6K09_35535 [Merismopedia sp. SIO2A8]|nr:hypothetical protein [Symploca sp. SIO2B6]NET53768.1 hypothetical protein [Merismopedia sp. SIO2A8]
MAKHTKAHLTRKFLKTLSPDAKALEKRKMKYYMGAKLIEVGVDPQTAILRWDVASQGRMEVWTCRAYWGESKDAILREES